MTPRSRRAGPPGAPANDGESSGYRRMYLAHVTQAPLGCDFDFMLPALDQGAAPLIPDTVTPPL